MAIAPRARLPRRRVDGILLLDKPPGLSSNAALQRAKRLYAATKAGHAGTLDPLATGLLPVCFGEATKFVQGLMDAAKAYRATIRFGTATTTGDAEGAVSAEADIAFDRAALVRTLAAFVGTIAQVPPLYAALKRDGRPYYAYARAGEAVERTARNVEIARLALIDWTPPDAVVDVECSKGTYVRVLAEDIALALGSRAHLAALRRTASAGFLVDDALTLDALEAMDEAARDARLLPPDAAVAALPALHVDDDVVAALRRGQLPAHEAHAGRYRVYGPRGFVGVVEATGLELRVSRLVSTS